MELFFDILIFIVAGAIIAGFVSSIGGGIVLVVLSFFIGGYAIHVLRDWIKSRR